MFNLGPESESIDPEAASQEADLEETVEPVVEEKTENGKSETEKVSFGALGLAIMVAGSEIKVNTEESDETGKPLKEVVKTEDGVILATKEHQYDEKGNRTETVFKNARGEVIGRGEYVQGYGGGTVMRCYNPSGEKLGAVGDLCLACIENPVTVNKEQDANSRVIKESMVDGEGRVFATKEHFYDENGQLIRTLWKNSTGESLGTIEHHYTQLKSGGRTETKITKDAQGNRFRGYQEKLYDAKGNLIIIADKDDKGQITSSIEYEYDENGREVRKIYADNNENGQLQIWMTIEYERDENGHIYHTIVRDGEGNIEDEIGQAREKPESAAGDYGDTGSAKEATSEDKTRDRESIDVKYDRHGKIIARIFYDKNKNIKMSIEYERDETGKKFHTVIKNDIGNVIEEFWEPGYQEAA